MDRIPSAQFGRHSGRGCRGRGERRLPERDGLLGRLLGRRRRVHAHEAGAADRAPRRTPKVVFDFWLTMPESTPLTAYRRIAVPTQVLRGARFPGRPVALPSWWPPEAPQ